mmetsp:Transcript_57530/g.140491  ORF Transcript_57530/g.140491 Transcript_57530/m.140491 type:complete len:140 (-) Transcript_57530:133-552(-)
MSVSPSPSPPPIRYATSRSDGTYKECTLLLVGAGFDCEVPEDISKDDDEDDVFLPLAMPTTGVKAFTYTGFDCEVPEDISKDDDEDDVFLPLAMPTTGVKAFTYTVDDKKLQNIIAVAVAAGVENVLESFIVASKSMAD